DDAHAAVVVAATGTAVEVVSGTSVQCRQILAGCAMLVACMGACVETSTRAVAVSSAAAPVGAERAETSNALLAVSSAAPISAASQMGS
ncbi:MAG: hypothetical protein AB4911_23550, partial [Oscillochloridaceae bacterium umkhey_bin13]